MQIKLFKLNKINNLLLFQKSSIFQGSFCNYYIAYYISNIISIKMLLFDIMTYVINTIEK